MKNKLSDVNNYTIEMIERLLDEDLDDERLDKEIKRGQTLALLVGKTVDIGRLALDARELQLEYGVTDDDSCLAMLEMKSDK